MEDKYYYPAVLGCDENESEFSVVFPDLNCATSGTNAADALTSSRELLGCVLLGLKEDGEKIPYATKLSEVKSTENEEVVMVEAIKP